MNALLAQLDRVTGYEPVGQGFESLAAHSDMIRFRFAEGGSFCAFLYAKIARHSSGGEFLCTNFTFSRT